MHSSIPVKIGKLNQQTQRKHAYQIDGLTFAIIVVFEFPPRESCNQRHIYIYIYIAWPVSNNSTISQEQQKFNALNYFILNGFDIIT